MGPMSDAPVMSAVNTSTSRSSSGPFQAAAPNMASTTTAPMRIAGTLVHAEGSAVTISSVRVSPNRTAYATRSVVSLKNAIGVAPRSTCIVEGGSRTIVVIT